MRLTHFVKVDHGDGRASLEASIHFSEHPDEIPIRLSQHGASEPIWLTWAEFDAVADLVWAHRPDPTPPTEPEPIARDKCGYDWSDGAVVKYCCLETGHLVAGGWLHVAADGTIKPR